jgi:RNA polymerase sigma factor (sigma-70 family)
VAATRIQEEGGEYRERIAALVAQHEHTLLRVARQNSLCHDDALDAYQRALEIYVRRVASVEPATEVAWLKVVVRHEAMAIRRTRAQLVAADDIDLDAVPHDAARGVEERFAATERARRSAEALRALKPDEAKALLMKAHGLSYDEIGERYGWTYTKVNRAMTEGRRRFLETYEDIESGRRCEEFAGTLEALAEGRATPRQLLAIRAHLRHCSGCRSTVRALHLSRLRRALLLVPLATWRDRLFDLVHRSGASEMALNVQAASAGGGGRLATAAAVLGLCVGGAGVGTMCSELLDDPPSKPSRSVTAQRAAKAGSPAPRVTSAAASPAPRVIPTVTPSPTASAPKSTSATRRVRRTHHQAKAVAEDEFGFEQTAAAPSSSTTTAQASSASGNTSSSGPAAPATQTPAPPSSDPAAAEFTP